MPSMRNDFLKLSSKTYLIICFAISAFLGPGISWDNIYLYHFIAGILLITIIINPSRFKGIVYYNFKNNITWIGLTCYCLASTLWAPVFSDAIKYTAYFLCGVFLIFVYPYLVNQLENIHNKVKLCLYIAFTAHLLLALIEICTDFRWPISAYSYYLSFFGK